MLTAMYGADSPRISESIRVSFGAFNTTMDIVQFSDALVKIVNRLRKKAQA